MIAVPRTSIPIPDGLASRIASRYPEPVLAAIAAASDAVYRLDLCLKPRYEEGRQLALADLARANKTLAAYNPRITYGPSDLPRQCQKEF